MSKKPSTIKRSKSCLGVLRTKNGNLDRRQSIHTIMSRTILIKKNGSLDNRQSNKSINKRYGG